MRMQAEDSSLQGIYCQTHGSGLMFEADFMKYKERTALLQKLEKGLHIGNWTAQKDMSHLICVEGLTLVVCTNTLESIVIYLACIQKHGTVMHEGNIREEQAEKISRRISAGSVFQAEKAV